MTYEEMKKILHYCRILGREGLNNGHKEIIPKNEINLNLSVSNKLGLTH